MRNYSYSLTSESGLLKQTWEFLLIEETFYLDLYIKEERPTKRHKFKIIENFSRLSKRDSTIQTEEEVNVPDYVKLIVKSEYVQKLSFKPWASRYG